MNFCRRNWCRSGSLRLVELEARTVRDAGVHAGLAAETRTPTARSRTTRSARAYPPELRSDECAYLLRMGAPAESRHATRRAGTVRPAQPRAGGVGRAVALLAVIDIAVTALIERQAHQLCFPALDCVDTQLAVRVDGGWERSGAARLVANEIACRPATRVIAARFLALEEQKLWPLQ